MFRAGGFLIISILCILTVNSQHITAQLINWKKIGEFPANKGIPSIGLAGQSAGIHNGYMIVAGGTNFPDKLPWEGGKKVYFDDVFLFRKSSEGKLTLSAAQKIPMNLGYAATVSTEQGLLMAGGENEKGILSKVMLLQVGSKEGIQLINLPDLPLPLTNAIAVSNKSLVYLIGGETSTQVSDKVFFLDLNNTANGWTPLPSIPVPVSHGVGAFVNGQLEKGIYIVGGRAKQQNGMSDIYSTNYFFDTNTLKWSLKTPLPYGLSAGTGVLDPSGRILILGGDRGEVFSQVEALLAQKSRETDPLVIEALDKKRVALQSNHPGFSNAILAYDIEHDRWSIISNLPFPTPVTTHAFLWSGIVMIPGGEVRAGVRTPNIYAAELKSKK